jgi:predicted nucleic acid-binding protein
MTYVLDTNACIDHLNVRGSAVTRKLETVPREEVAQGITIGPYDLQIAAIASPTI